MNSRYKLMLCAVGLLVCCGLPDISYAFTYKPYMGHEGFQEIKVDEGIYFVAAHGSRQSSMSDVEVAWQLRSAELCDKEGMVYFMPLKYSFEPVLRQDIVAMYFEEHRNGAFVKAGGGFICVPIFVPGANPNAYITAPSKMSHVRCFNELSDVVDQNRAVDVKSVLQEGKSRGWIKSDPLQ